MKIKEFKSFIREEIIGVLSETTMVGPQTTSDDIPGIAKSERTSTATVTAAIAQAKKSNTPIAVAEEVNDLTPLQQKVYDFEEEISRPESLRFFTLDDQLKDYFEKVLPKKGKITKFEYNKIAQEVDRLREIYERVITVTDTNYTVDLSRKEIDINWIKPISSKYS